MQKTSWIIFTAIFFSLKLSAQSHPEWTGVFTKINAEVLANSKGYSSLKEVTGTIGHRLTGSPNGKKAEDFAYHLLKSYGFEQVKYQPFEVESWSRGTLGVEIAGVKTKAVTLAHSPVKADVTGDLVDLGNGLEADYQANPKAAKGKIVLIYLGILPGSVERSGNLHRSEKTAIATKYGATGVIIFNTVNGGTLLTGTASVTGKLIPIPAVCIGKEEGLALRQKLKTSPIKAHIVMKNFSGLIKARNVLATIPGSSLPNEKIVIGGHLDSWDLATGAIDNGIGSFSVIDMARTFQVLKLRPKRTIEFVMFMGEEEGLLGSKAYVDEAIKSGDIRNIDFMLNYDMTNDSKGFNSSDSTCKQLFQSIGAIANTLDTSFSNTFSSGAGLHSDHQPFMLHGIPTGGGAGSLARNVLDCYHADCDVFALVDEKGMKNTIRFNAMLLYGLADTEKIPAKHRSDEETKEFLIKNNLQQPLMIAGEWRWKN
ncbi:MAG: M28 family peptidase [Chitinophagaceae bacterium]